MGKNRIVILLGSISFFLTIMIGLYCWWYIHQINEARKDNFMMQIGTYRIDMEKTDLGFYKKDSLIFSNLEITFCKDSTFSMNMSVPFLYDSIGVWIADGGAEAWNSLDFGNNIRPDFRGIPFTRPWTYDSIFYIVGPTPKRGKKHISKLYFKKLPSSTEF
jgi:hypothetical protein